MKPSLRAACVASCFLIGACGPTSRATVGGDDTNGGNDAGSSSGACATTQGPENTPATCSDGLDNDCNGLTDCDDPSCSGIGNCPICGMVQHPVGGGIELPDGVGNATCSTPGTQGACPSGQLCYADPGGSDMCREPYTSKLNFTGFATGQTFTAVSNIQSVCVNMEHSWWRDLEIDLVSPTGQVQQLQKFEGQMGGEIFVGIPNDDDSGNGELDDGMDGDPPPTPGVGWDYCWTPTATKPDITDWVTQTQGDLTVQYTVPAGNYGASGAWTQLMGATLNGDWTIRIADLWPEDNGFLFKWSIAFDPTIVQNCSGPVIQ